MTQITIPSLGPIGNVSQASFEQKLLEVTIALASGVGGAQPSSFTGGGNAITITGARTSARITYAGSIGGFNGAEVSIWGLSQTLMNQLQTFGVQIDKVSKNTLSIAAGDKVAGLATCFVGTIIQAWGDYNAAPDVAMRFACAPGAVDAVIPFAATSINGGTVGADIITVMSTIAKAAGWGFVNNSITPNSILLRNPYFAGAPLDQARRAAEAGGINAQLLPGTNLPIGGGAPEGQPYVLAIWPRNGFRPSPGSTPVISPDTGMIGYPTFAPQSGIFVKTLFNPQITFGGQISVESSLFTNQSLAALANPSSLWTVYKIDHALDSLVPHGEWASTIYANVSNPQFPTLAPA